MQRQRQRPVVLLTGFGPFPGIPENASSRLVPELAREARHRFPGYRFEAHVLATEWVAGPEHVGQLYRALEPVAGIHFGVAPKARGFEIEARGINARAQVKDACGELPVSDCVADGGPAELASRLPVGLILARLRRRGIPAMLSRDAGRYLCNALLYNAVDHARRQRSEVRSGFIHMPALLPAGGRRPSMAWRTGLDWGQALAGALEIIAATLRQPAVMR